MFGSLGFWEITIIAGIALIVIGPERFPDFAKMCLRTIRDFRKYVEDMRADIHKEISPVKKELNDLARFRPEDVIDSLTKSDDDDDEVSDDETPPQDEYHDPYAGMYDFQNYDYMTPPDAADESPEEQDTTAEPDAKDAAPEDAAPTPSRDTTDTTSEESEDEDSTDKA